MVDKVEKVEPISTQDATTTVYKLLRWLGLDNLNRTWLYILYAFQLNFSGCILQLIAFTTSYAIASSTMTMDTFLTSLQAAINVYTIFLKVTVMFFSMGQVRKTAPVIDALDAKIGTKEERALAEKMIKFCRGLVIFYSCAYLTYSTSTWIAALINGHPPYALYIPFCNWQESKLKMFIASVIEYYLISVSCMQDVGLDTYALIFIYMARMHMKILCIRVEQLGRDPTKSKEDNEELLIDCVDTHRKILDLIGIVRPVIANTVFIQFVTTAGIMGVTLINIMMYANFASAIGSICYILAISMETLPICYTMDVLTNEINNLPTAMYSSNWFEQSKSFRHMMVFFMQNAQKFETIMAGNIMPIQVSTFLAIGKLAFSIYALVNNMAERRTTHAAL